MDGQNPGLAGIALLLYPRGGGLSSKKSTFFGHTDHGGMDMRFWKACVLFYLGGGSYMTLEFLWRGRSHGSMFILGGLCFLLIGQLGKLLKAVPLAVQLLLFSAMITFLELLTGLAVNGDYGVWDYRAAPYNYLGQICLPFTMLWIPVSLMARELYRYAEKGLQKPRFSAY